MQRQNQIVLLNSFYLTVLLLLLLNGLLLLLDGLLLRVSDVFFLFLFFSGEAPGLVSEAESDSSWRGKDRRKEGSTFCFSAAL